MFDFLLRFVDPQAWRERKETLALIDEALDDWTVEMEDTIPVHSIPKEDQFLLHTPTKLTLPMKK